MRRTGDQATTQLLGVLAATGVFTLTFYTALDVATNEAPTGTEADASTREAQAATLLDLLLQPGAGWYEGDGCQGGVLSPDAYHPDRLQRLGLGEEACGDHAGAAGRNALAHEKLWSLALEDAPAGTWVTKRVPYEAGRASLDAAPTGSQFQLRIEPYVRDDHLRLLYVAAYERDAACFDEVGCGPVRVGGEDAPEAPPMAGANGGGGGPAPRSPVGESPEAPPGGTRPPQGPTVPFGNPVADPSEVPCTEAQERLGADCTLRLWRPRPEAVAEATLVQAFAPLFSARVADAVYDHPDLPYDSEGGVVPDDAVALGRVLEDRLQSEAGEPTLKNVNVLLVGSNVTDAAWTNPQTVRLVGDWVEAGGTLIVLGASTPRAWPQPDWGGSLMAHAGGVPTVGDPADRVLRLPSPLRVLDYSVPEHAWTIGSRAGEYRFAVADEGDGGAAYVAVSRPGAYGHGHVVFSSWRAHALGPDASRCVAGAASRSACEAVRFVENLVHVAFEDVAVEYGPEPPLDGSVAVASRRAGVDYPLWGSWFDVRVIVAVWSTGPEPVPTSTTPACGADTEVRIEWTLAPDTVSPLPVVGTFTSCGSRELRLELAKAPPTTAGSWSIRVTGQPGNLAANCPDNWDADTRTLAPSWPECTIDLPAPGVWTLIATTTFDATVGEFEIRVT